MVGVVPLVVVGPVEVVVGPVEVVVVPVAVPVPVVVEDPVVVVVVGGADVVVDSVVTGLPAPLDEIPVPGGVFAECFACGRCFAGARAWEAGVGPGVVAGRAPP